MGVVIDFATRQISILSGDDGPFSDVISSNGVGIYFSRTDAVGNLSGSFDGVSGDLCAQLKVGEKYGRDRPWELKCRPAQRTF
jgi:hypothetical protein